MSVIDLGDLRIQGDYRDSEVWYSEPYGWSQLTFLYVDGNVGLAYFKHKLKWNRFHCRRPRRMRGK